MPDFMDSKMGTWQVIGMFEKFSLPANSGVYLGFSGYSGHNVRDPKAWESEFLIFLDFSVLFGDFWPKYFYWRCSSHIAGGEGRIRMAISHNVC